MFGKLTGSFYQMNSRQTIFFFFFPTTFSVRQAQLALWLTSKRRAWAAHRRARDAACPCDAGSHYGCWYHIQYVLKPLRTYWFIYRRRQIVSHCAWPMLSPIPSAAGGGGGCHIEARRRFVYGEVRGGGERTVGVGVGVRVVGTPHWAKQNKEGAENNLKVSIDPAPVIVHIFHSPTGPIPVSLKCKETEKGN